MMRDALAPDPKLQRLTLAGVTVLVCLLAAFAIGRSPAPLIDLQFGDTTIHIAADRAWTLWPGDCVVIQWELEGIKSLYIEGAGRIGWGEMQFCPGINATNSLIEVTAGNGIYRRLDLEIHHLPDLIFYLFGFVGFLGALLLAAWTMWVRQLSRPLPLFWLALAFLLLVVVGAWLRLSAAKPPVVDEGDSKVAVRFWAEQERSVFPHECVDVWWSVTGAEDISFNGKRVTGSGNPGRASHCAKAGNTAILEVVSDNGARATYALSIPSPFTALESQPLFVYLARLGILLGAIVFLPLLVSAGRDHWRSTSQADLLAISGFVLFVLLLYLPVGFDSAGQWEEWLIHGYSEGGTPSFYRTESVSRIFVMVPHSLAYLITSESFVGYHLVHFLMHAGKMIVLYGILRQLGVSPLYAFLTTVLFMIYPVNSALMTLRRLPKNFSMLTMLISTFLMLVYCKRPRPLVLIGIWLGLLYSVMTNETGFALILVVPLLWWLRDRRWSWRNLNLTVIWYLVPLVKVTSFVLTLVSNRVFYQRGYFSGESTSQAGDTGVIATFLEVMGKVFHHTFVEGWQTALTSLQQNAPWPLILVTLAGIGGIAWYLAQRSDSNVADQRHIGLSLLSGLLIVIAAVAVLMWIPLYRHDPWRMYLYVSIGAAIAVFSAIRLLISPIRRARYRNLALIAICLAIMLPAYSRLVSQHEWYVGSANRKAAVLLQVLELAPAIEPTTQVLIMSELSGEDLEAIGIFEFVRSDMVNSALQVLYQENAPKSAYFCLTPNGCGVFSGGETVFTSAMPADLLQRTLVFRLNQDLSVDLLEDPAAYLGIDSELPYDANLLYDADAPLPARAHTMLGAAIRD